VKEERVEASKQIRAVSRRSKVTRPKFVNDLVRRSTRQKSSVTRRAYQLMRARGEDLQWNLNYGGVALMWRGVVSSVRIPRDIKKAFVRKPDLINLL